MAATDYTELVTCKPDGTLTPVVLAKLAPAPSETYSSAFTDWAKDWSRPADGTVIAGWKPLVVALRDKKYLYLGGLVSCSRAYSAGEIVCQLPPEYNPNRNAIGQGIEITASGTVKTTQSGTAGTFAVHLSSWKHYNF